MKNGDGASRPGTAASRPTTAAAPGSRPSSTASRSTMIMCIESKSNYSNIVRLHIE